MHLIALLAELGLDLDRLQQLVKIVTLVDIVLAVAQALMPDYKLQLRSKAAQLVHEYRQVAHRLAHQLGQVQYSGLDVAVLVDNYLAAYRADLNLDEL